MEHTTTLTHMGKESEAGHLDNFTLQYAYHITVATMLTSTYYAYEFINLTERYT